MIRSRSLSALMAALVLFAGVSCSSDSLPTGVSASPAPPAQVNPSLIGSLTGLVSDLPLLSCKPQPYATATQTIGPDGGTLVIGPHRLVIPAGALSAPVQITGTAPSDNVVSVEFQPQGLQFNPDHLPRLTLDYSACGLVWNVLPKHIVYTSDNLNILEVLWGSIDNLLTDKVSANIKHFSRYAVAF
ncbi:MAG TPA: hypothetical protein VF166_01735 [Gemmatimonadaceae bacterium]